MQSKRLRLRRALSLHQHLQQIETGRLARQEMLVRQLKEEEARLMDCLEDSSGIAVMLSSMVLQRLQNTACRRRDAETALKTQAESTREQTRRVKQAEKLVERAEQDWDRELAANELREIIDRGVDAAMVSAPQVSITIL